MLLLAHRTGPPTSGTLDQLRTTLLARNQGIELDLAPLDGEAIDELVARTRQASAEQRERIATLAHGNPYMAIELAERAGGPSWVADLDVLAVAGIPPRPGSLQRVAVAGSTFDIDEFVALSVCRTTRPSHSSTTPSPCGSWNQPTPASASATGWSGTRCSRTCRPIAGSASTATPPIASRRSVPHRPGSATT